MFFLFIVKSLNLFVYYAEEVDFGRMWKERYYTVQSRNIKLSICNDHTDLIEKPDCIKYD